MQNKSKRKAILYSISVLLRRHYDQPTTIRFTFTNQEICFKNYQTLPAIAQKRRSTGDWKTGFTQWNIGRRPISRSLPGKSPADFISKMEGSLQELDETAYWPELLIEANIVTIEKLGDLQKETDELTAIFVASVKTAKRNK